MILKLICSFVFAALLFGCGSKAFVFDGKKPQEVKVNDIGNLFSNYKFKDSEKKEITGQLNNKGLAEQLITYSKEENWPSAINTLDKRLASRTTMQQYRLYKVATFGNNVIVAVPASKNRHMPAGFVPPGAMYIVFKKTAVSGE